MTEPLILVTNDDGIESPGLRAAVEAVCELGDVLVMAPTRQQTAMGRSLHGDDDARFVRVDLDVGERTVPAYHCNCSPAKVVLHGLEVLCRDRKPALLISGINYGENLGSNITLSGTVGAALQGAACGIPAVAASLETDVAFHYEYGAVDWNTAAHFTGFFARLVLASPLPPDVDVLKVDVPRGATAATPWRLTRLARQSYYGLRIASPHPESAVSEWQTTIEVDHATLEPESDIHAVTRDEVVSVTPLSLDLTSRVSFDAFDRALRDGH